MRISTLAASALVAASLATSSTLSESACAQLAKQGTPASADEALLGEVPTAILPQPDVASMMQEELLDTGGPLRFGAVIATELGVENTGRWDQVASTTRSGGVDLVWRVELASPGAFSLGVLFDEYELPESGRVFVYSPDRSYVLGAFDASNRGSEGQLMISPVPGDRVVIEYVQDLASNEVPKLRVGSVVHDYRNIFEELGSAPGLDVPPCLTGINCSAGDGYEDVKRSVVQLIRGGVMCSGVIVNNTAEDSDPLLMAATPCGNMTTATVVFDFENPGCTGGGASNSKTLTGATLLTFNEDLNSALYRLDSSPPESYRPYYAGWTRSFKPKAPNASISHTSGLPKSIALDFDNVTSTGSTWAATWEIGSLDTGSYGSPLLEKRGRMIGILTSNMTISECSFQVSYYGRFNQFWNQSGLAAFLDPLDRNPTGLVGLDPFEPIAVAYNGSGVNANVLTSNLPEIGTTWTASIDTSGHPGATATILLLYAGPDSGSIFKFGEVLVDLGSEKLARSDSGVSGNVSLHSFAIPGEQGPRGSVFYAQAVILGGGFAEATNALKLRVN